MEWVHDVYLSFFGASVLIAPEYLALSLLLAFVLHRLRRVGTGFWAWAVPARIWRHPSHRVDVQLFVIGRLLVFVGLFNRISAASLVAVWVAGLMGSAGAGGGSVNPWLLALLLFVAQDGTMYWLHRLYHTQALIWPIHAVHHKAEVMTPVTAYRQHPLALIISAVLVSAIVGLVQGVVLGVVDPATTVSEVAGINTFIFGFALLFANFRHSHIWISFGPVLERIIISPAQHQVHHSVAPEHHNKNFGDNFAIWDWMFGTLYVTRDVEDLTIGVLDATGAPEPGAGHLSDALARPFRDMAAAWRARNTQN